MQGKLPPKYLLMPTWELGLLEKQLSIRMNIMKTNMFVSILYTVSATYNIAYIRPGYYIIRLSIFLQKCAHLKIYLFLYTNRNVGRFQDPTFLANLREPDHIFPTLSYGCFHILILDLDHWFGVYCSNDFDYGRKIAIRGLYFLNSEKCT